MLLPKVSDQLCSLQSAANYRLLRNRLLRREALERIQPTVLDPGTLSPPRDQCELIIFDYKLRAKGLTNRVSGQLAP